MSRPTEATGRGVRWPLFLSFSGDIASGPAIILLAASALGAIYIFTGAARGLRGRQTAPSPSTPKRVLTVDPR